MHQTSNIIEVVDNKIMKSLHIDEKSLPQGFNMQQFSQIEAGSVYQKINYLIKVQQDYTIAQMDENESWKEEKEKEGLFTIYFNENPLIPYSNDDGRLPPLEKMEMRKFHSEIKIKASHKNNSRYQTKKITNQSQLSVKHAKFPRKNEKIQKRMQSAIRIHTLPAEDATQQLIINSAQAPPTKLKIQDINKHFTYDIDAVRLTRQSQRKQGLERSRTCSKITRKSPPKRPEAIKQEPQQASNHKNKLLKTERSINSDEMGKGKPNLKVPFLEYIKKHRLRARNRPLPNVPPQQKLTLYNVITINNPYQLNASARPHAHK